MPTENKCPHCGKPVSPDALMGLCPECMLKAGQGTGATGGAQAAPSAPPAPAELGRFFPQLEIIELLGRGGMGAVYKARQKQLDRFVALKILPPSVSHDPAFADRFAREAKALAKLNHPNIVTLYEFGQADGLYYFLMEFVDGVNLRQLLNSGRIAPREALAIVPQICDALQYAHDHGIVHRDIKPENILLDRAGHVKVADFGLAKLVGGGTAETVAGRTPTPLSSMTTEAGQVVGTPQYMAPEQVKHPQEVDHRADIYSLGVVFYQMLTGELPGKPIEPPSSRTHGIQIDVRLDEVVLHALEKEPDRRYQQASVLKTEVETIITTPPVNAETFTREVLSRDYVLNIGSCLRRGWALVLSDFWPVVGIAGLIWLLLHSANSTLVGIVFGGPLMGGLQLYFLRKIRGEQAGMETTFSGFSIAFVQLFLASLVIMALTVAGFVCLVLPGIYLLVAWTFALPLVIDKRLDFWPAMELSRKTVSKHWWKFFGFAIVLLLVKLAGILVFCVGFLVAVPVALAASMYAYEDIFGSVGRSAALASSPAMPPRSKTGAWKAVVVVAAAVVLILAISFGAVLVALIVPALSKARERAATHRLVSDFVVRGTVSDAVTGKPIAVARVADNVYGARPNRTPREAWTDATGRYKLKTWYEEHSIAASAPGYETKLATLLTKPFGKEKQAQMDFLLQPTSLNGNDKNSLVAPKSTGGADGDISSATNLQTELPPKQEVQGNLGEPYAHKTHISGGFLTKDEVSQDFNQVLSLAANGRFSLDNVNGRIDINGWNRDEVVIKAIKHGKTRESVEAVQIEVEARSDHIAIHTRQPATRFWSWFWWKNDTVNVDYTIQVPQQARLEKIISVNGEIVIDGVSGDIEAITVNGETQINGAAGSLKLSTVNGQITVDLASLGGSQTVSLNTVNGQIVATLPDGADAEVSANTVNGSITSEFALLTVKKEFPVASTLRGTLGNGDARVKANAVNGTISFRRGKDAQKSGANQTKEEDAGLAQPAVSSSSAVRPKTTADQVAVEDLALQMLVAIREKDDDALRALATDRITGWTDALPQFAIELRERFRRLTDEPFDMREGESIIEGDLAAVKCTGPEKLGGIYLVLFFVKTGNGWRNYSLRNSPPDIPLAQHFANFKREIEEGSSASTHQETDGQ
ncbi:MAG: protein kinase [Verrucomicrobiia bacterium]